MMTFDNMPMPIIDGKVDSILEIALPIFISVTYLVLSLK